jgi:integrase
VALTKRGTTWHYDFIFKGRRFQGSTHQTNINKAKLIESKVRSDAAMEDFGITPRKDIPTLKEFLEGPFLEHCRRHAKAKRTADFYSEKIKRLLAHPWTDTRISDITGVEIGDYCQWRNRSASTATTNGELATLRKALNLAFEWNLVPRKIRVRLLPGANVRDFVVSPELEAAYLEAATYPLKEAAILILDLGIRPEECVKLRKADIANGALTVREGKSKNAARSLPLTERASYQIELLCALWPDSEWLFPGRKGRHYTRTALDNRHTKLRNELAAGTIGVLNRRVAEANRTGVNPLGMPADAKAFVLYSFRHTFATRLAESGASPFEMIKLLGHFDIRMTQRYVHPRAEGLSLAMKRKELLDKMLRGEVQEDASEKLKTS